MFAHNKSLATFFMFAILVWGNIPLLDAGKGPGSNHKRPILDTIINKCWTLEQLLLFVCI